MHSGDVPAISSTGTKRFSHAETFTAHAARRSLCCPCTGDNDRMTCHPRLEHCTPAAPHDDIRDIGCAVTTHRESGRDTRRRRMPPLPCCHGPVARRSRLCSHAVRDRHSLHSTDIRPTPSAVLHPMLHDCRRGISEHMKTAQSKNTLGDYKGALMDGAPAYTISGRLCRIRSRFIFFRTTTPSLSRCPQLNKERREGKC